MAINITLLQNHCVETATAALIRIECRRQRLSIPLCNHQQS